VIQRPIGIGLIQLVLLDRCGFSLGVGGESRSLFLADSVGYGFKVHVCMVSVVKASGLSVSNGICYLFLKPGFITCFEYSKVMKRENITRFGL
jgi:hypothetical protein